MAKPPPRFPTSVTLKRALMDYSIPWCAGACGSRLGGYAAGRSTCQISTSSHAVQVHAADGLVAVRQYAARVKLVQHRMLCGCMWQLVWWLCCSSHCPIQRCVYLQHLMVCRCMWQQPGWRCCSAPCAAVRRTKYSMLWCAGACGSGLGGDAAVRSAR